MTDKLFDLCDPLARVANIVDALPNRKPDDLPLRECLPGIWPTLGDIRKIRDEMVRRGWTNNYEQSAPEK